MTMKVEHDLLSPMEGRGDLYRAGTQPGPRGPLPAPEGARGGTGGILHEHAPRSPRGLGWGLWGHPA